MARPTISDLADAAGLSTSTVKRVISGGGLVRADTMERVRAAAEEIGFYGLGSIRGSIASRRPQHTFGIILQQPNHAFGQSATEGLEVAAKAIIDRDIRLRVYQLDDLSPEHVAAQISNLDADVEAVAIVAAEHPIVTEAIDRLAERGVPVFALVSPLSARLLSGYIGLDGWKVGRTAAWAFETACRQPGKLGILVGTHRYRCHELNEAGFRSYFREHGGDFTLLEAVSTFESEGIAREVTDKLLREHDDVVGIYAASGGIAGVVGAIRDAGKKGKIVVVTYDLSAATKEGLLNKSLTLVISHPFMKIGQEAITAMLRAVQSSSDVGLQTVYLPFDVLTPENL
ncbi:LacI family DNA-binding transcriptional regulator [Mesorhizobium sp. PL10]